MRLVVVAAALCLVPLDGLERPDSTAIPLGLFTSPMTYSGTLSEAAHLLRPLPSASKKMQVASLGPIDFPLGLGAEEANEQTAHPAADPEAAPVLSREELCSTLAEAAQAENLPVAFFHNLIWQESRFNHKAVSPVGAQGVAQFMPRIAGAFGVENPFDAQQALPAAARMLRGLFQQFGNLGLAAAAYNAGSGRVSQWLAKRKKKLPQETRTYVLNITGRPVGEWRGAKPTIVAFKLPARKPCRGVALFAELEKAAAEEEARAAAEKVQLTKAAAAEAAARAAAAQKAASTTARQKSASAAPAQKSARPAARQKSASTQKTASIPQKSAGAASQKKSAPAGKTAATPGKKSPVRAADKSSPQKRG
jgi:transglycosylase-like protein with SLT domain